jgi:hypothetical protein
MSISTLMPHRATIEAPSSQVDRFGQSVLEYTKKAENVPCRLSNPTGGITALETTQGIVRIDHIVYFPATVQLDEQDRITMVTRPDGTVIARNLIPQLRKPISTADGRSHHIEVPCTLYRGYTGG